MELGRRFIGERSRFGAGLIFLRSLFSVLTGLFSFGLVGGVVGDVEEAESDLIGILIFDC
jgi:hypothetical protein